MVAPPISSSRGTPASTGTSPSPRRPLSSWKSCRTPAASPSPARTGCHSIGRVGWSIRRCAERSELVLRQPELRCAYQAIDLPETRGARNRRRDALARDEPGERHFGRLRVVRQGHGIERRQDAQAPLVEVFRHGIAACALPEIGLAAVFAREKSGGKAVVDDDPHFLRNAEVSQRALVLAALAQVVFGLLDFVARQVF